MSLKQLAYLCCVADQGFNVTRAANTLSTAQPSVSREMAMSRWQLKVRAGGRNDYAAFWC